VAIAGDARLQDVRGILCHGVEQALFRCEDVDSLREDHAAGFVSNVARPIVDLFHRFAASRVALFVFDLFFPLQVRLSRCTLCQTRPEA